MPELAEVEFIRKRWNAGVNQKILAVQLHADKRIFRGTDVKSLAKALRGATLIGSETHGKQMAFRFSRGVWLGIHLGMTGELRAEKPGAEILKHDHLVLHQKKQNLVFSDPRQFGRVLFHQGPGEPDWWKDRPVQILSPQFTVKTVADFLQRHSRAPMKGVLLMQNGFPGVGNWMADEILWQAGINPQRPAGKLPEAEVKRLVVKTKSVCRISLQIVGTRDGDLPATWLFGQRWGRAGKCPIHHKELKRATVGGRTTSWCPICQKA